MTFEAPQKTATGKGSQPEQSQPGATRAGNLLGKSSVLVSVFSANLHGDQPRHTESSQASAAEKDPRRAHRNAPAAVPRNPGREEDDDFSFSQDLASLSEILKGGGISEERLARQAETRASSVHEFRQLREKRASIFKGALRIQKKGPSAAAVKGAVRVGQSLYGAAAPVAADRAQRSGVCAPRGTHTAPAAVVGAGGQTLSDARSVAKTSVTPCRGRGGVTSEAVEVQGTAADKDRGLLAPVVPVPAAISEATPSRKALPGESKTPRSICKSGGGGSYGGGTTGFGAKADMTPSNLRAKGVAGIFGSLLKDRARTAATPSGAVPFAVRVGGEVEEPALPGRGIAMQLDMGNEDVSVRKSPRARATTCAHASPAEMPNAKTPSQPMAVLPESRQRVSLGSAEICESSGLCLEPVTRIASAMQAQNKHAHEAACSGSKGRSRKSILLAEARQRVGAKTPPPRRKLAQGSLMLAATSSAMADPNASGNGLESTTDVMEPVSDSQSADAALAMELASLWNSPQGCVDAEISSQDNDRAANPVGGISTMDKGAWLFGRGVEWGRPTPLVFTSTIDISAGKSLALLKPVCKRACADKAAVRHQVFDQAWSENADIAVSSITMGGAAWSRGVSSVHASDDSSVSAVSPLPTLLPSSLHSAPSASLAPSQVPTPPRDQTAFFDAGGERKFTVVCDVEPEDEATLFDGDDEVVMLIHSKKSAEDRARGNFDHRKTILLESASHIGTA